jgi:hypothetical protein
MLKIINQSGTSIYNFDNVVSVICSGRYIKIMLPIALCDPNDEQRLPQIVIAVYGTAERAEKEFDKFIAKLALSSNGVWQFPKESE